MAVKTKKIDPAIYSGHRVVSWSSSEVSANDILDVDTSLGRPGFSLKITTDTDAAVTFRINSYSKRASLYDQSKTLGYPVPDWTTETEWTTSQVETLTVENGEEIEIARSVKNLEVTAITPGAGTGVTILVR